MGAFRKHDQTRPSAAPAVELDNEVIAADSTSPLPDAPESAYAADSAPLDEPAVADAEAPVVVAAEVADDSSVEPVYRVAPGVGLTSNRGILTAETAGPGVPGQVWARDFLHSQETIDHLVSTGALVKS